MLFNLLLLALLVFAIALVLQSPSREVTQPPGKMQRVWELVAPGTSPAWGIIGSFALIAWMYLLVQDVLHLWKGSPYIVAAIAMPNITKAYGVPGPGMSFHQLMSLINPSWVWIYLAPAVLFAVNLAVVFRDKLFRRSG